MCIRDRWCEEIYQMHQLLNAGEEESIIEKSVSQLESLYEKAAQRLQEEVLSRKEVVLLPYKAKYWDKMKLSLIHILITTPLTFAASANCILYCGGTPVFADIDSKTYNIDPADIERKITAKTKAIIPVHLAGQPCDMDHIHEIARRHHLLVIEDGAHALGSVYKGRKIEMCIRDRLYATLE